MCKKKTKLTDEQKEALKCARREKRSAFLSRMVDEFKKIVLIATFFVVVGFLVWEHIIYANGTTPAFPPTVSIALITAFFGTYLTYCMSSTALKKSLNDNGMVKNKDGTFSKIVSTVVNAVTNATAKSDESNDDEAKG